MSESIQKEPQDSKENAPTYHLLPKIKQASKLEKLVSGILQLFNRQEQPITELHFIEVLKLQETTTQLLTQMRAIKDLSEHSVDEELFYYIKAVVGTMDQNSASIHDMLKDKQDVARQVKAYELYAQWIAEARPWVHILSGDYQREIVIKMAASYLSAERIERDIRSIRNYPSLRLAEKYRSQLEAALTIPMKKLQGLKYLPEDLSLDELNSWKAEVDQSRGEYYNEALKIIDNVIQSLEGENPEH